MSKRTAPAAGAAEKGKSSLSAKAQELGDHTHDVFTALTQGGKKHHATFNPTEIRKKRRKVVRILKGNNALAELKADQRLRNNAAVSEEKDVAPGDIWVERSWRAVDPAWIAPKLEHDGTTTNDVSVMIMDIQAKEMAISSVPPQMLELHKLSSELHYRTNPKPTLPPGMTWADAEESSEWKAKDLIYKKGPKENQVSVTVLQLSCIMDNGCLALVEVHGYQPCFYVPFKKADARRILQEEFPDIILARSPDCEDYMLPLCDVPKADRPRVRQERNEQLARSTGFARQYCDRFGSAMEKHLQREHTKKFKWTTGDFSHAMITSVTPCVMQDVYGYDFDEQLPFMRIQLASEAVKRTVGELLASREGLELGNGEVYKFGLEMIKGRDKVKDWKRYNFTLSCDMSFMIEQRLSGMSWITLPARKYEVETTPLPEEQFIDALKSQSAEDGQETPEGIYLKHVKIDELQAAEKLRRNWYRATFKVHMCDLISHHDSAERARKVAAGDSYVAPSVDWNRLPMVNVLSLDIECAAPRGEFPKASTDPIITIAVNKKVLGAKQKWDKAVLIWDIPLTKAHEGLPDPNDLPKTTPSGAAIWRFPNEKEMMKHFLDLIRASQCPVQITFNGLSFDYPYIFDRCKVLGISTCRLVSPFRESMRTIATTFVSRGAGQNERTDVVCPGILIYDLLRWAQHELKLSSLSLNSVAEYVTGNTKYDLHFSHITSYFYGTRESRLQLCEYNDMDVVLPLSVLEHPKRMIIESNTEIARVCGTTIGMLMCKGQGIKTESMLHRLMRLREYGFVCPDRRRPAGAIEKYTGNNELDDIDFDQVLADEAEMGNQFDGATCVVGSTPITLADGSTRRMDEMYAEHGEVLSYHERGRALRPAPKDQFTQMGMQRCVKLTLETGRSITCTPDHKIMMSDGHWVEARDTANAKARIGLRGATFADTPPIGDDVVKTILVGSSRFSNATIQGRRQLHSLGVLWGLRHGHQVVYPAVDGCRSDLTGHKNYVDSAEYVRCIKEVGEDHAGPQPNDPLASILASSCPFELKRGFVRGWFGYAGVASTWHRPLGALLLTQQDATRIKQIRKLLLSMGIRTEVDKHGTFVQFRTVDDMERFLTTIGYGIASASQLQGEVMVAMLRKLAKDGTETFSIDEFERCRQEMQFGQLFEDEAHCCKEAGVPTYVLTVDSVEDAGEHPVYDISVPSAMSFTGESLLLHNCVHPKIGFYTTCVGTLDFASLYPSLIIGYNLSFDTWIRNERDLARLRRRDPGCILEIKVDIKDRRTKQRTGEVKTLYFVKKYVREGILCSLVAHLLTTRNEVKRLIATLEADGKDTSLANARSTALKLAANSAYGFPSAFKLYLPDISEAVCNMGRQNLEWTIDQTQTFFTPQNPLNPYGKQATVIYGDTDSIMVNWHVNDLYESNVLANMAESMCNGRIAYEMSKLGLIGGWAGLEYDETIPWAELIGPQDWCPINLVFEKVYSPYQLMRKKNYLGMKFDPLPRCRARLSCLGRAHWTDKPSDYPLRCDEHHQEGDRLVALKPPKGSIDSKGIESKRRDKIQFVKDSLNRAAVKMMALVPWREVLQSVRDHNEQLARDDLDLSQVKQSASVKISYGSKCRQSAIIEQLKQDDPNFRVKAGMRVSWVLCKAAGKNLRVYERVVEVGRALRDGELPDYPIIAKTMIENAQFRLLRNYIEHPDPNAPSWQKEQFKLKWLNWTQEPFKATYSTYDRPMTGPMALFAQLVHTCRFPGCKVELHADREVEHKAAPLDESKMMDVDEPSASPHEDEAESDDDSDAEDYGVHEDQERGQEEKEPVKEQIVHHREAHERPGIKVLCDKHQSFYYELHQQLLSKVERLQAESDKIWAGCTTCAARVGCDAKECKNMDCDKLFKRGKVDTMLKSNRELLLRCQEISW